MTTYLLLPASMVTAMAAKWVDSEDNMTVIVESASITCIELVIIATLMAVCWGIQKWLGHLLKGGNKSLYDGEADWDLSSK
jgi:hypothetical protein